MSDNELRSKIPKEIVDLLSPGLDIVIRASAGIIIMDWALLQNAAKVKQLTSSREVKENYELVLMPKVVTEMVKAST